VYDHVEDLGVALRNIGPEARQDFYDIKTVEKTCYPEIQSLWSDVIVDGQLLEGDVGPARHRTRSVSLETSLTLCLERFKNLDEVHYVHTSSAAPERYHQFFQK
jgi:hypothetical protein